MALSTVSGILSRTGMGRLGRLGLEPAVRYERSRPGELSHVDIQQLGRIEGGAASASATVCAKHKRRRAYGAASFRRNLIAWEYVHVAVDDYSRLRGSARRPESKHRGRLPPPRRRFLPPTRSLSNACSPTTAAATAPPSTRSPVAGSASATYAPVPTGRKQTGKQNALSAPGSTAGPTARSTAQAANGPTPLTAGSGTTINDDTQPSATNPRSAEPNCSGLTPRSRATCAIGRSDPKYKWTARSRSSSELPRSDIAGASPSTQSLAPQNLHGYGEG
jgi:hypothetical protein